jgi:alpha-N-arabinofuranosidase
VTGKKGTFKTPLFHTFKLFSNNCLGNSIDTYVECDTFNTGKYNGIPYLDATTVYNKETGTVFINVVNRHKDKAITVEIVNAFDKFSGKAEASLVNAGSAMQCCGSSGNFSFDIENCVVILIVLGISYI